MPVEFSPKVPIEKSPLHCGSISSVAARRSEFGDGFEVEFGDSLEGLAGGAVPEAVRQGVIPGGVFSLQDEQLGDGVAPSLEPGPPIGRATVADRA